MTIRVSVLDTSPSIRADFVLDRLALFEPLSGAESRHLTVELHSAQAVQLARDGERDWVVDARVQAQTRYV